MAAPRLSVLHDMCFVRFPTIRDLLMSEGLVRTLETGSFNHVVLRLMSVQPTRS